MTNEGLGDIETSNVYFWLGDEGAEELTEDDFEAKIAAVRKAQADYLNAR